MFDAMMEWMSIPMLYTEYGTPPRRVGLTHPTVAPYGVFTTKDDAPILISVQNDREWVGFCTKVLRKPELATDPRFATNTARVANRADTDGLVSRHFGGLGFDALADQLERGQIAFARVNDVLGILTHPHLRRMHIASPAGPVALPLPPASVKGERATFGAIPGLGEHTTSVRREFLGEDSSR
jgi:formyl-CoA transferase